MRIFVTQPLLGEGAQRLHALGDVRVFPDASRILPREILLEEIRQCDILCCLLQDRIDRGVIEAAGSLRLIAAGVVVPANVDVAYATARGIPVTSIPNIVAETTADLQWGLMLAAARRIVEGDKGLRHGLFPGSQSVYFAGGEVHGRTLGSIGLGAIGKAIARRASGFGMRILYTQRHRLGAAGEAELGVEFRSLDDLLRESDFVTLNASYNPEAHHLIGAAELAAMKPTAYLINTARGPLVDEAALVDALAKHRIAGAALDVYEQEPKVHPGLLDLDNAVLTPHLGSATRPIREQIASVIANNVEAFVQGRPLPNLNNPAALAR
ncbi:MAG: 2-hydroxyacid dehydrogenase [Symbiobacteriia bacterium]